MLFKIKSPNTYVVHPDWSSFRTRSGLYLGEESFDRAEDMPVHLYPTKGIVVSVPDGSTCIPGDILYFTWNAVSFNKCVSPIEQDNLFAINKAWYAYERDGQLFTTDDFFLLKPVSRQDKVSDTGLLVGGYSVVGSLENAELVELEENVPLVGLIEVMPPETDVIKKGDKVCIVAESDVKVQINGNTYYRVRSSEILFSYE